MTRRSCAMAMLGILYTAVAVTGALMVAAAVARSAGPDVLTVFAAVFAVLCVAAGIGGDRLVREVGRQWDAHWDEDGVSWAVSEAERILHGTGERR